MILLFYPMSSNLHPDRAGLAHATDWELAPSIDGPEYWIGTWFMSDVLFINDKPS